MAKIDPDVLAHLEWLGFVRPTGLVVSAPALVRAGAILDRRDAEGQRLLRSYLNADDSADDRNAVIKDFKSFASLVLGWSFSPKGYAGTDETSVPDDLGVPLPEAGETLRPDFAVRELEPQDGAPRWQLLVRILDGDQDLDRAGSGASRLEMSPQSRMERLLRETEVPAGLLTNAKTLRLISAPRGESSGWIDFRVDEMTQSAGRPIVSALRLLLSERRLLALDRHQRLAALLQDSRKFQNEVSERLAEQVLHALYELLRGFQSAHDRSGGQLLRNVLDESPDDVYRGLLTVILRLVFILYAEERDMLPEDETFRRYYSLAGLYDRLREDAALYPDTMDHRFGGWAQLLAMFRLIHDGARTSGFTIPPRHGALFDPDAFKFLEGRPQAGSRQVHERILPPLVSDGTVYRALENLLVLDGERISYRALDVEQIGSVYETMMGFRLETAVGRSVAIRAQKKRGAPTAVDLEALTNVVGVSRAKWLLDRADCKLTDVVKKHVANAGNIEDLHAALLPVIDQAATPDLVPKGAMVLQPSEERRRSGSHYTPRALTEPIVRATLDPLLGRLRVDGRPPPPDEILNLKICDPAMGSGAFLVEACRYLGDALVEAWHAHRVRPDIPPDEDEVVFARRLVAQRCLYGVDRNPVAADLAKMSLWLVTLAKDHPLTFLDHALRQGDSLVGLSRRQIEAFHWKVDAPRFQAGFEAVKGREQLEKAAALRSKIREADESVSDWELRHLWDDAQSELSKVRLLGDLTIAAFFEAERPKRREVKRLEFANAVVSGRAEQYLGWLEALRRADPPFAPFHWEIEFPEVFERENPGFDAFVGNPPFMFGSRISSALSPAYSAFLAESYAPAQGKSDLVAYFFRRAFDLMRLGGTLGLLATNTIRQGATRFTGLRWIRTHGGRIYSATRRLKWPGAAAVVVSVVHVAKDTSLPSTLDGKAVPEITAYLLSIGPDDDPARLDANRGLAFSGVNPNGKGFVLTSSERATLLAQDPKSAAVMFPYLGSDDMNDSPQATAGRFIIFFNNCGEDAVRVFPAIHRHLHGTVRLQRQSSKERRLRERWWLFSRPAAELTEALKLSDRVLVSGRVATHQTFAFQPARMVFSDAVTVFRFRDEGHFAVLQSQIHELWARFQGSSFKDDPRYIPEDCFETFPLPDTRHRDAELQTAGKTYYEFRAGVMAKNKEGLTSTYNRFHDPDERDPDILKLRDLHAAMDRAVLNAYSWADVPTDCEFLLDYGTDDEELGGRKKPWRYRWPDHVRDEVLARLLELNTQRAAEEARAGRKASPGGRGRRRRAVEVPQHSENSGTLFE